MLKEADIDNPSVDAFYLLEYAAGLNKTTYLMYKDQEVKAMHIGQYMDLIKKRQERIPYQYITGRCDFAGLTFEVDERVLIPRLDTEVLFENALRLLGHRAYVLDLCTGSGALGISLKRYRPDIRMVISDISKGALDVARANVEHNHIDVAEKSLSAGDLSDLVFGYDLNFGIRVIKSDLFDNMAASEEDNNTEGDSVSSGTCESRPKEKGADDPCIELTGRFDMIVSNPPYVTEEEYKGLMPEVKDHEPKLALTAGADGLDIYRRIAKDAPGFLKDGGLLLLEIGAGQAKEVTKLLSGQGFSGINVIKDLSGLDRVVTCRYMQPDQS